MDFEELSQFLQLCQTKSISRAAKNLFLTQQGLSKIIRRWEKELGVPLFERSRGGLVLTRYGTILKKYAESLTTQYNAMRHEMEALRQKDNLLLVVADLGVLSLLGTGPIVAFSAARPDITLAIQEHTERTNQTMIAEKQAALRLGLSIRQTGEYDYVPLYPLQGAVLLNKENPLAQKEQLSIEDLKGQNMLACGSTTHYAYTPACEAAGFSPRWILSSVEFLDPLPYVRTNYGICTGFAGFLPDHNADDGTVVRLMDPSLHWSVGCLVPKERTLSKAAESFLSHMVRYAQEHPLA